MGGYEKETICHGWPKLGRSHRQNAHFFIRNQEAAGRAGVEQSASASPELCEDAMELSSPLHRIVCKSSSWRLAVYGGVGKDIADFRAIS